MRAFDGTPPPGSRARFEPGEDGFTLVLPPLGFRGHWHGWASAVALLALGVGFSFGGWLLLGGARGPFHLIGSGLALVMGLVIARALFLLQTAHALDASLGRVTLVVAGRRLYAYRRGLRTREWVWDEGEITALDEGLGGLWVLGPDRPEKLFAERDADELRWVAGLLRHALAVPDIPPPRPGEVVVYCTIDDERYAWRGFLRARPGHLDIRHVFSSDTRLPFHTGPRPRRAALSALPSLEPEDVRWLDDGRGLQIDFTSCEEDYTVRIECDDPEALRAAVARFWEAHDPEPAPEGLSA